MSTISDKIRLIPIVNTNYHNWLSAYNSFENALGDSGMSSIISASLAEQITGCIWDFNPTLSHVIGILWDKYPLTDYIADKLEGLS